MLRSVHDHDDWNAQARGETPMQRADRAYGEILQELRVAQTGVQILFAFLLALAFQARFGHITSFQRGTYVGTGSTAKPSPAPAATSPLGALDLTAPPAFLTPPELPAPALAWGTW